MSLKLSCTVFANGQVIPAKYTCDGENISPPLRWGEVPQGVQSFALIVEDPDAPAGTFDHWILFNIPAATVELGEGVPNSPLLDYGMKQGLNGFNQYGYGGPCPPKLDDSHRYFFHLYALDITLPTLEGATKREVKRAMERHVLAEGVLLGTYARMDAARKVKAHSW